MKYIRTLFVFLLFFPFVAYAQQTTILIHNIPTNSSTPLTSGSCLLVDQYLGGGAYLDTKICNNWAATFGGLSIANNLSDIPNPNQAWANIGGNDLGKLPVPAQSSLLGSSGVGFTNIALGANLSLANNVLSASGGQGGTPGGTSGQIQYNVAGTSFGGFDVSGDFTINTSTGAGTLATVNSNIGTFVATTINAKGLVTAGSSLSGDCASSGSIITCTKSNGVLFAASATTDATNASNITSGTLPATRLPNSGVTAGSYTNTNITVDATGRVSAASNGSLTGVTWPANGTLVVSNTTNIPGGIVPSGDWTINTTTGVATLASVNSNIGTFVATTVNAKGLVTAAAALSGDCTTSAGVITCTKTSGATFVASATTDTTNASNITSGILPAARLPSTAVTPGSYTNVNATVDATGRITSMSNGATAGVTWPANGTIVISNTTNSPTGVTPSGDWTINTTTGVATLSSVNSNIGRFESVTINAKGLVTSATALSGDCTTANGVITCTKTSGAVFAPSATTDTTNASNITSGTLPSARLPSTAVTPGSYTNTNITVDATGRITTASNGTTSGVTWPANGTLVVSNTTNSPAGITPSGDWTINTTTGVATLASVNSNVGTFVGTTVNAKGLVTSAIGLSGDCTTAGAVITCTKTNGTAFAPSATTDTTNATNITSGTLPAAQLPASGVTAGSYTLTNLTVDATGRITAASNGVASGAVFVGNTTGSANTYTISSTVPSGFTLNDNYVVCGSISATNTGPSTLTVSPASAIAINTQSAAGLSALVGGELKGNGNQKYCFQYSSAAGVWVTQTILGPSVNNNQPTTTITQAQWADQKLFVITTASQTITLPTSTSLNPNYYIIINAIVSFTLAPAAASGNTIQTPAGVGAANASVVINAGNIIIITTDGAGHFYTTNDGTAALQNVGTSGATLGLLNANKTDSGNNIFLGNNSEPLCTLTDAATVLVTAIPPCASSASNGVAYDGLTLTASGHVLGCPTGATVTGSVIVIRVNEGLGPYKISPAGCYYFTSAAALDNQGNLVLSGIVNGINQFSCILQGISTGNGFPVQYECGAIQTGLGSATVYVSGSASAGIGCSSGTSCVTAAFPVTAGDMLAIWVQDCGTSGGCASGTLVPLATTPASGTGLSGCAKFTNAEGGANGLFGHWAFCNVTATGSPTVTVTYTATTSTISVFLIDLHNAASSPDAGIGHVASGASATSASSITNGNTQQSNGFILSGLVPLNATSITPGGAASVIVNNTSSDTLIQSQIAYAPGNTATATATFNPAANWILDAVEVLHK